MRKTDRGLRVLLTADAVGGVWTYAQDLARGLAAEGCEVVLAVLGPEPTQAPTPVDGVRVVQTGLPLDWADVDEADLDRAGRVLADLARAEDVDVVHLNSPILAANAGFDRPIIGACHSCVATWWDAVRGEAPLPAAFQWRTERLRQGYQACDALIAPSAAFAEQTHRRYGVRPQVVWNGRARRAGEDVSGPRRPLALTTGRLWDEAKGIADLDRAAALMRHRIAAAGPVKSPAAGSPATFEHLDLLGWLPDPEIADRLAEASVFASAAKYEPFGLSVLEAAQAGCALVLTDLPVFRELWDGAAVFVEPSDAAGLAATLDGLLDDEAEARRLGGLAAERSHRFSLAAMTDGTRAVYGQVAGAASVGAAA